MKYTIDTTRVSDEANRMNDIANSIMNASDTLNGIIGANALCTDSGRMIMRSLMSVKKELDANAGKTKKYAGALSDIAALYGNAEKKAMGEASFKAKNKYNQTEKFFMGLGYEAVKGFAGPFGNVAELAKDDILNENDTDLKEDKADIEKDAYRFIRNIVKYGSVKTAWSETFGLDKFDDFEESVLGDYAPTGDDFEVDLVVINWGFVAIKCFDENYKEFNGITPRMIEETAIETDLSVSSDLLVALAAYGTAKLSKSITLGNLVKFTGGYLIDHGGNYIAKQVTGNPDATWKESTSDALCDLINPAIGEVVKKAGSAVQWIGSQLSPICVS